MTVSPTAIPLSNSNNLARATWSRQIKNRLHLSDKFTDNPHEVTRRDCHFAGTPFRTKGRGGCSRMVVSPPPRVESYAATVCYPVFCHPDEFDATVLSSLHDRWQQHDCLHDRWRNHVSMMAKAPLSLAGVSIRVKRGCYHQNDCLMLSRSPHRRRSSGRLRRATTSSCGKRCRTWTATRGLESWPLQPSARLSFNCTPLFLHRRFQ